MGARGDCTDQRSYFTNIPAHINISYTWLFVGVVLSGQTTCMEVLADTIRSLKCVCSCFASWVWPYCNSISSSDGISSDKNKEVSILTEQLPPHTPWRRSTVPHMSEIASISARSSWLLPSLRLHFLWLAFRRFFADLLQVRKGVKPTTFCV